MNEKEKETMPKPDPKDVESQWQDMKYDEQKTVSER